MKNFLTARWENLIMANYAVDPYILLPFLPKGTELDFYNGNTFVSLVGFMFKDTRIFRIPIPGFGTFEEINLRFYVIRKEGNKIKRGVVFINETVPYKFVAWLANKLYKEHYTTIPTKHSWIIDNDIKQIEYQWKVNKQWNSFFVKSENEKLEMPNGGIEEFIFEHYFGYTKISNSYSEEYEIEHPSWKINKVQQFKIKCNFDEVYGKEFKFLNDCNPDSVIIAEGSSIAVKWKRNRF